MWLMEASVIAVLYVSVILIFGIFTAKYQIKVAKKEGSGLLAVLGIIGGAWLTSYLIEKYGERKTKYSCPNCNSDIDYNQGQCKVCHSHLKWNF